MNEEFWSQIFVRYAWAPSFLSRCISKMFPVLFIIYFLFILFFKLNLIFMILFVILYERSVACLLENRKKKNFKIKWTRSQEMNSFFFASLILLFFSVYRFGVCTYNVLYKQRRV